MPFSEIGPIVGRTPDAAKMLASRAHRRVRSGSAESDSDPRRQREIVDAFLAAARAGDFDALVGLLDPDVVLRADMGAAAPAEFTPVVVGAAAASLDEEFTHNGELMSLRLIYLHMIEEYARHIGHADFLREQIDGATGE